MAAQRVAPQAIAHQTIQTIEAKPHVGVARGYIDARRRANAEHRYAFSSADTSRCSVGASNPCATSIRRPLLNSTRNALELSTAQARASAALLTNSTGSIRLSEACGCAGISFLEQRRRYVSSAANDKPCCAQKACRVRPLCSNSNTSRSASTRLRRRPTATLTASLIQPVHHSPTLMNRCSCSDGYQ